MSGFNPISLPDREPNFSDIFVASRVYVKGRGAFLVRVRR